MPCGYAAESPLVGPWPCNGTRGSPCGPSPHHRRIARACHRERAYHRQALARVVLRIEAAGGPVVPCPFRGKTGIALAVRASTASCRSPFGKRSDLVWGQCRIEANDLTLSPQRRTTAPFPRRAKAGGRICPNRPNVRASNGRARFFTRSRLIFRFPLSLRFRPPTAVPSGWVGLPFFSIFASWPG